MKRETWNSKLGVVLAVAGSAVGLGNFLRFPGQAAQNGGGAFLIPYFVSLLILGIPLCWAEWTMARYGGVRGFNSAPGVFMSIRKGGLSKFMGALAILIPLVIYMYYVVIEAWCLGYAFSYLNGSLILGSDATAYEGFFAQFTGLEANGHILSGQSNLIYFLILTMALNTFLIYRGIAKGIESFVKLAMPLMVFCAVCVLIRVLTLGTPNEAFPERSVTTGLGFMWNPDFSSLFNPQTWLAAAGQIFFSLSVGFGVIINYASYLSEKDDVVLSGLTASSMNEFFEVCLGGLITIPAAFIFLGPAVSSQGTFSLGFNTLPNVFASMPGGQIFGFLWYFMLFLAAVTSSLSMLQPVNAFLKEIGFSRMGAIRILLFITLLGTGFVAFFSKGLIALDTFDFWVGTLAIVVLALLQSIMYAVFFTVEKGAFEAAKGAKLQIPPVVNFLLKYVSPTYLVIIFIGVIFNGASGYISSIFKSNVAFISVLFIMILTGVILFLINRSKKSWKGLDQA